MNIIVCISSVPDTTSKIRFNEKSEFDTNGIQFIINPYDEFGLTKAVKIKETLGGTITVVTVGDITSEPVIRKSLAIGADKAVRININPKDSFETASLISEYIKDIEYDIIIAGRESIDYNGSAVACMIAEMLDIPFVNACIGLNLNDNTADLVREVDGGKEFISSPLPLIIGGQKGLVEESELLIPNMRGIMQSRSKPLEIIEPKNIANRVQSISLESPPEKKECRLVEEGNVKELITLLQNEAKVI